MLIIFAFYINMGPNGSEKFRIAPYGKTSAWTQNTVHKSVLKGFR